MAEVNQLLQLLKGSLSSMAGEEGPASLDKTLQFLASRQGVAVSCPAIHERILSDDPNDLLRCAFNLQLLHWDNAGAASWTSDTYPNTRERRAVIYERLQVDEAFQRRCDPLMPPRLDVERQVIIAEEHEPWYEEHKNRFGSFYWSAFRKQLIEENHWPPESVVDLDETSSLVVERLSDPCRADVHQVKGLVVGHVQSGKTANFTAVIAKAVDSGYRLVIVLAGMLNLLRKQTQRRLDMELVGQEIIQYATGSAGHDYAGDSEWGRFVKHGGMPADLGANDWQRLTGPKEDYEALRRGIDALQFERSDPSRPFNVPANLRHARARLIVIKKNPAVIRKLVADLERIDGERRLVEVPALIIDDESDQASVDTSRPTGTKKELADRKATNREIVRLLRVLPRSQYVGYTATPFANVFIDPDDEADLFPKDFLIPLRRPVHYMGVRDFYDLDGPVADGFAANERAYNRDVRGLDSAPENLPKAIDSFVLAGAIKLYREAADPGFRFKHHTMLVHRSSRVSDHDADARLVNDLYERAGYRTAGGMARLERLFREDFIPVHAAQSPQSPQLPMPAGFSGLKPRIGEVLARIEAGGTVAIVNGERARRDEAPDFDKEAVWRILVGGTKLSRGYTVEGLTVSYYRRRVAQSDTLMQMGRWFGFRRGYRDLVRLFIGRAEPDGARNPLDLFEAFRASCRDEEVFRAQLDRYSLLTDSPLTPKQVPPLVPMHMRRLRPTGANKMFNASIESENMGGTFTEPTLLPTKRPAADQNLQLARDTLLMERLERVTLGARVKGRRVQLRDAFFSSVSNEVVADFLARFQWSEVGVLSTLVEFIRGKVGPHGITGWTLLLPQVNSDLRDDPKSVRVGDQEVVVVKRARVEGGRFGVVTDPAHRAIAQALSGLTPGDQSDSGFRQLEDHHRGVILLYPCRPDTTSEKFISLGMGIIVPRNDLPTQVKFTVYDPTRSGAVVIDQAP